MPMAVSSAADIHEAAQAICAESCAFRGEPACWRLKGENGEQLPWPPKTCDDPGCMALAIAAVHALTV